MKGDRVENNNFPIKQEVNEPNEAFSACIFYVRMGTGRTLNDAYRKYHDRPNARQTNRKWIGWIRDFKWQERADIYDKWVNQGTETAIAQCRERSLLEVQGYFDRLNLLISRDLSVDEGMADLLESFIRNFKEEEKSVSVNELRSLASIRKDILISRRINMDQAAALLGFNVISDSENNSA
jgi:hypothetical protein